MLQFTWRFKDPILPVFPSNVAGFCFSERNLSLSPSFSWHFIAPFLQFSYRIIVRELGIVYVSTSAFLVCALSKIFLSNHSKYFSGKKQLELEFKKLHWNSWWVFSKVTPIKYFFFPILFYFNSFEILRPLYCWWESQKETFSFSIFIYLCFSSWKIARLCHLFIRSWNLLFKK